MALVIKSYMSFCYDIYVPKSLHEHAKKKNSFEKLEIKGHIKYLVSVANPEDETFPQV